MSRFSRGNNLKLFPIQSWFNKFVAAFAPRAFHLSYSTRGGTQPKQFRPLLVGRSSGFQSHPNLDGLVMTVTTDSYRFLFSHYVEQTLADVVNFHAEAVASSATKRALLTKQLLSSFDEMHRKRGYTHGSFSSKDVLVDQNLWITVGGWERQALVPTRTLLSSPAPETQLDNFTARWCGGEISNFDYIMELNRLAGRHFGDPSLHPIMPWVTDFTGSEPSSGRRDLSKSKYRLNKGDEQLDWQFMETTPGSTPHHITHLLSDVTYFVYLARRTPVPVLRKFVRSKYEPNEYPVSVRRVFDWTPDECIPEFYSDPTIFASLHADMPDLQLPEWAPSPVDFVAKHREALESDWVSESLHEWIDLAFGYKLTGQAAVESKNVALPLAGSGSGSAMVDRMTKHGIHQLFTGPHPQKAAGTTRHEETTVDALADALQGSFNSRPQTVRERFSNAFAALSIPPPSTPSRKGSPPPAGGSPADFRKGHDRKPSQPPIPNVIRHQRSVSRNEYFDLAQQVPQQQALAAPGSPQMVSMEIAASPDLQNSSITSELYPELASSRKIRIAGDTDFAEPVGAFENVNDFKSSLRSAALEPVVPEVLTELEKIPSRINLQTTPIESATGFGLAAAKDVADLGRVLLQLAALPESRDQITTTVQPFRIEAAVKEALESGSAAKLEEALATAPRTFRGPLRAMLSPTWSKRPTVSVLLQDSSSPLVYDPSTTFPFPGSANVLYDYVAQYEASHGKELVLLTVQNLDTLSRLEDEPFQFLLPYILPLFTTPTLCCDSWTLLFDRLAARIGPEMTQAKLLKPLAALFEPTCNEPGISKVLFSASFLKQLVRRFGLLAFCEKVLPLYIPDALQAWVNTSAASSSSAPTAEDLKDSATSVIEAALGIASQLGPILTGKYVTQPLLSVVLRDPSCAPILHYLVVLMGSRFGELFIVHQFFPVLKASLDKAHKAGGPVTNKYVTVVNSLSLLEKFANHLTATSLVAEMTEMVPTLSRLIESLTSAELDYGDEQRKVICVRAFSYLVRLSDLLNGHADWRPQILPILIRFFAGAVRFVGQSRKATDPTRPNLSIYSPEVVGQVFAGFQALLGRDLLTRVPTSSSIERMLKERPSDEDRVYEEQLSAVVTRSNSSAIFESNYWVGDQPTKPKIGRSASMPLSPGGGSNGIGSLPGSRKTSPNDSTASDSKLPSAASLSAIGERLADVSDFTLSLDNVLTRPFKASDAKARGPPRPRSEATEDRAAWARLLSTTNEVSRETTEMTFRDLKLRTYVGHGSRVNVVAQDECSRLLATGSRDRTVKLWSLNSIHRDIENGLSNSDAAHTYTAHQRSVSDVAFLDSSLVTCDGSVHLWSIETGQLMHQFEVKNRVVSLLATPSVLIGATVDNFLSWVIVGPSGYVSIAR